MTTGTSTVRTRPQPRCPLRKDFCTLCQVSVTGPQDCPIVYLSMADSETRAQWAKRRAIARGLD